MDGGEVKKKAIFLTLLMAALALAYTLGRHQALRQSTASTTRRILYYVDPMNPTLKSDKPGIAACGMALEPVYADDAAPSALQAQLPPGAISINGEMQRLLGIRMAAVEKSGAPRVVRIVGRVVPEDTRIYKINSGMEGFVRETYNDSAGILVKKDQKLATCYSPDSLSVASGFLAATAGVAGAVGKDGNRTMPFPGAVSKQGVSSLQGYTDRLLNLGMSGVQIKQMAESRQLPASVDVVAPVDGFILERNITPGQHFDRSMEFYRIADLSHVWIIAQIFENEAQYFRPGVVAHVSLPGQRKTFPARISSVLPQVDPATRTLKLRLETENPGFALRPDMFVDVELPLQMPLGLTVPVDAVVDSGLKKRVFVDRGNGFFEPREVESGWQFGDRVQIVKGLSAGERVVAAGTFLLDSESRLRATAMGATSSATGGPEDHGDSMQPASPQSKPTKAMRDLQARNPKCGMEDSKQCQKEFGKDPDRYLAAERKRTSHDGPGHD
jgi:RND family efflux transporter MFP subunit